MLTFFRNFFKTKVGLAIALAFLGLIGFAFASMDVSSTGAFGGVAGGDRVAVVGDEKISTSALNDAAGEALRRVRQENPDATIQTLLAGDGLDNVLDGLIDRFVLIAWGEENGLRAGRNLVNSEIRQIPGARGPSGDFDESAYQAFLNAQSLTDSQLRQQVRTSLFFRQSIIPATYGTIVPDSIAETYARTFKERRRGSVAVIPATAFAPTGNPTDAQLTDFYSKNSQRFVRPERRSLRYASFGADALGNTIEPTDAQIQEYFRENAAEYAARETRSFTQLIVATRQGAEAIAERVRGGQSFAAAANAAGFRTAQLEDQERDTVREQASAAVADAYFSASEGGLTAPARSPLGWHIARVDDVTQEAAKSLASVRGEIADVLRERNRQRGIAELATTIEDRLADGASLTAVAEELNLEIQSTQPLTASGFVYGTQQRAPEALQPALDFAFQIEEGEPEIAALPDGQNFIVYEVATITPSATAPLAEIRENVIAEWRRVRGNEGARAAADRVLKRVEGGATLAAALAEEDVSLPSPDSLNITREEVAQMRDANVPAPVALFFSMAEGTSKKLEGSQDQGWYIVSLDDISLGELEENDPLINQAKTQISQGWSAELSEQMITAMRAEVGVERNSDAIAAVRRQLLGETN